MTYEKYLGVSDAEHIKKIIKMPVHFLKESGKGFFVPKEGCVLALCEEMRAIINNESLAIHMKDVIEYRAMDYYKRRYNGEER